MGIAEHKWHSFELEEALIASRHGLIAVFSIYLDSTVAKILVKGQEAGFHHQRAGTLAHTR